MIADHVFAISFIIIKIIPQRVLILSIFIVNRWLQLRVLSIDKI